MKIGVISRWNATCGVSMHAEMLGREFIRMGYDLRVFAPSVDSANRWWHHKIIREDEDFVIRCYKELDPITMDGGWLNKEVILSEDPDLLIVESYASLPYKWVGNLIEMYKNRAIVVIHEGCRDQIGYNLRIFDKVVVFDERYIREVVYDYQDRVEIIPYPCNPVRRSKRRFAEGKLTFFSFGRQPVSEYVDYIKALDDLASSYDFVYRVIRSDSLLPFNRSWLIQEQKRLSNEEVYECLHSSDIHLLPKGKTKWIVISSTLLQCLGTLVPTIVPNSRHFETLPKDTVVVYEDIGDLKKKIRLLIEDDDYRMEIIKNAEKYVEDNRIDRIAGRFVELFEVPVLQSTCSYPSKIAVR
jgi:glycosyltransferase involved in cell wall biosynthesis